MQKITNFWNWFKSNNKAYLTIDDLPEDQQDDLMDELLNELHLYCDKLYFELGGMSGQEQELIITAEGDVDYFEEVEALINEAPKIDQWRFIAFIPPVESANTLLYEDVELKSADMWFIPLKSASKSNSIGIKVCVPNYAVLKESKWLDTAVYKCLDIMLGEKSFALDIAYTEIGEMPAQPEDEAIQFSKLPSYIAWSKRQVKN